MELSHLLFLLIESDPFLGGWTYGLDWFETAVRLAMGMPLPDPPAGPRASAAAWFVTCPPGVVSEVCGLDDVLAHRAVMQAEVAVAPGDVVAPLSSSHDRVGHVLLKADAPEQLEEALAFVRATLRIKTRVGVSTSAVPALYPRP